MDSRRIPSGYSFSRFHFNEDDSRKLKMALLGQNGRPPIMLMPWNTVIFVLIITLFFGLAVSLIRCSLRESIVVGQESNISLIVYGKPAISFKKANHERRRKNTNLDYLSTNEIVSDKVYWSDFLERQLPAGYTDQDSEEWSKYVQNSEVIRLKSGCGRMQNRLVQFNGKILACARFRQNIDQIQGEFYSYILARHLNLTNMAPLTIAVVDRNSRLWSNASADLFRADWRHLRPVILTKFIDLLQPSLIPTAFRNLERHLIKLGSAFGSNFSNLQRSSNKHSDSEGTNSGKWPLICIRKLMEYSSKGQITDKASLSELIELVQWSDLIVFDYLIANLDRMVNNMFNFQWNPDIMEEPAHNLLKHTKTNLLLFLDNESGLLHGYRLIDKYEAYHSLLLSNLCVFRRSTIAALRSLQKKSVQTVFSKHKTNIIPPLPETSIQILSNRIDKVLSQVEKCRYMFSGWDN